MATEKKNRQRLTMEVKRVLGLKKHISLARKIARHMLDFKYLTPELETKLDEVFKEHTYNPGCECCGDSSHTWKGKNGSLVFQYSTFRLEKSS